MTRMLVGWAIGLAIALLVCWFLLPHGSLLGGMIVGGCMSLLGLWLGAEWDLSRHRN